MTYEEKIESLRHLLREAPDVQEYASRSAEYVIPVTFTANREPAARQSPTPPEGFRLITRGR